MDVENADWLGDREFGSALPERRLVVIYAVSLANVLVDLLGTPESIDTVDWHLRLFPQAKERAAEEGFPTETGAPSREMLERNIYGGIIDIVHDFTQLLMKLHGNDGATDMRLALDVLSMEFGHIVERETRDANNEAEIVALVKSGIARAGVNLRSPLLFAAAKIELCERPEFETTKFSRPLSFSEIKTLFGYHWKTCRKHFIEQKIAFKPFGDRAVRVDIRQLPPDFEVTIRKSRGGT